MKKLYFIRHGQTVWNQQGRMTGAAESPLTEHGRAQAKKAGQHAKAKGMHFDLIVSSPLSRALQTAQLIAQEVGYPVDQIVQNKLLLEQSYGEGEGVPYVPRNKRDWKGMESNEGVIARAQQALDWLEELQADSVLVVAHSAYGRAMRSLVREEYPMHLSLGLPNAEIQEWL